MAENSLNITCSEQVLKRLEAKSARAPEKKVVDNYKTYKFSYWIFLSLVGEFGGKCIASFRYREVQSETNKHSQLQSSFQLC